MQRAYIYKTVEFKVVRILTEFFFPINCFDDDTLKTYSFYLCCEKICQPKIQVKMSELISFVIHCCVNAPIVAFKQTFQKARCILGTVSLCNCVIHCNKATQLQKTHFLYCFFPSLYFSSNIFLLSPNNYISGEDKYIIFFATIWLWFSFIELFK